jgi:methyltransferase
MFFSILLAILIIQRLTELWIARKNEAWMREHGAYEVGKSHYKYIVAVHVMFFVSLLLEVQYTDRGIAEWWMIPFFFFIVAQILRVWSITSLGRYWNTRIIILPGINVVSKGPYRFLRHPNYLIVATEILVIPLIFQAYFTAILFTLLNALVLSIRIPIEEKALKEATNYEVLFKKN